MGSIIFGCSSSGKNTITIGSSASVTPLKLSESRNLMLDVKLILHAGTLLICSRCGLRVIFSTVNIGFSFGDKIFLTQRCSAKTNETEFQKKEKRTATVIYCKKFHSDESVEWFGEMRSKKRKKKNSLMINQPLSNALNLMRNFLFRLWLRSIWPQLFSLSICLRYQLIWLQHSVAAL